jgi:hypothetical protein
MRSVFCVLGVLTSVCIASQICNAADPVANTDGPVVVALVNRLTGKPVDCNRAAGQIEDLPWADLPLLQEQEKRDDLTPYQQRRLTQVVTRIEARVKLADARLKFLQPILTWRSKSAAECYEKDRHNNPAWDENVRLVLKLDGIDRTKITDADWRARNAQMSKAIDAALAAGCDDPDFLCIAGLFKSDTSGSEAEGFPLIRRALADAIRGKMSPLCATIVIGRTLRARAEGQDGGIDRKNYKPTGDLLCNMSDRFEQACRVPGVPPEVVASMAGNIFKTADAIHCIIKPLVERTLPPLEKGAPNNAQALTVKAQGYIYAAWQARGGGWANNVTPEGWKGFSDDLRIADESLRRAWELDPGDPDAPIKMLTVALGEDWPRAEVDKWFQRAMAADPDNKEAVHSMLWYLQPKWHGSYPEMVEFGKQCFETRNWKNDIAFELATVHSNIANECPDPEWYYHHDAVWADISAVYTAYLDLYPNNNYARSGKARYACLCGQWKEANKLFKELGDKVEVGPFSSPAELKQLKQLLAQHPDNDAPATQP